MALIGSSHSLEMLIISMEIHSIRHVTFVLIRRLVHCIVVGNMVKFVM